MAKDTSNADAIPTDMADEALASTTENEEWEDVQVGLGRGWDFDKDGDLVGLYLGVNEVPIKEENRRGDDDRETAKAHSFGLLDNSGEIVFVWGSYEMDLAMSEIGVDDKVKIHLLGVEQFSSDSGPRQVKRYRVQKAVKK
jgi:hypothetical protein